MDLSVLIAARNEEWLERTVADVLTNARAETEVIVVMDGEVSPLQAHERVTTIVLPSSIGQRAAINLAARLSTATYVMKLDAHCRVDEGFDRKLIDADLELDRPDVTQIPAMYNLHAFDWRCTQCGTATYQGPTPVECRHCKAQNTAEKVVYYDLEAHAIHGKGRPSRTEFWCFDGNLHFQYWHGYGQRPEAQGELVDVMSSIGACFFLRRVRFWELGGMDEQHGSWGQCGTEVACKAWLSGGRQIVNRRTWFAHLFRTQGGDFGFPYPNSGRNIAIARRYSQDLWRRGKWPLARYSLSWLVDRFWPVPGWTEEQRHALQSTTTAPVAPVALAPASVTKGIAYYSDNRGDPLILSAVRQQLAQAADGLALVSATLGPIDFGLNLVPRTCSRCGYIAWNKRRPRACPRCGATTPPDGRNTLFGTLERDVLTMFRQQLACLEALTTDYAFMCEHDVLYHPSHFAFTPPRDDTFYYNQHTWRVRAHDGRTLFYYCSQVSGLCAYRPLLVDHYRKRVAHVEQHGYQRSLGYEPSGNARSRAIFGNVPIETWMSEHPNVDIKTSFSLTPFRDDPSQFRDKRTCQGWEERDEIPWWGRAKGRFPDFLRGLQVACLLMAMILGGTLPLMAQVPAPLFFAQINPGEGAEPCDSQLHPDLPGGIDYGWWQNLTGDTVYIRKLRAFVGASYGYRGDILIQVWRSSYANNGTADSIFQDSWDHYAEPTNWHPLEMDFTPDAIVLQSKDWLTLKRRCSTGSNTGGGASQFTVTLSIYYTKRP